jgi:hypothetical protein
MKGNTQGDEVGTSYTACTHFRDLGELPQAASSPEELPISINKKRSVYAFSREK